MKMFAYLLALSTILALEASAQECPGTRNIALKRQTKQSSTFGNGPSHKANDGNTGNFYFRDGCSETTPNGPSSWWTVQFEEESLVTFVTIVNRGDCCGGRLRDFKIFVSDTWDPNQSQNKKLCKHYTGTVAGGVTISIQCDKPLKGRYLSVYMDRGEQLTLCEVEVYGTLPCDSEGLVMSQRCLLKCYDQARNSTVGVLNFMDCAIDCLGGECASRENKYKSNYLLKSVPCANNCYRIYLTGTYNTECEESTASEQLMHCFTECVLAQSRAPALPSPAPVISVDTGRVNYLRCYVECLRSMYDLPSIFAVYPCTSVNHIRLEQCSHRCSIVYSKAGITRRDLRTVENNLDNSACILDCGKESLRNACASTDKIQLKNCALDCTLDDHTGA